MFTEKGKSKTLVLWRFYLHSGDIIYALGTSSPLAGLWQCLFQQLPAVSGPQTLSGSITESLCRVLSQNKVFPPSCVAPNVPCRADGARDGAQPGLCCRGGAGAAAIPALPAWYRAHSCPSAQPLPAVCADGSTLEVLIRAGSEPQLCWAASG